jgi:Animal haem peroxidase
MRRILLSATALVSLCAPSSAAPLPIIPVRTLDGSGNNVLQADLGRAGTPYLRVAAPNYADGLGSMVGGPSPRYVSNRIFNDLGQNLFSENDVSQWGWAWGQFLDHDFGLRDERSAENASIPFDKADRLEQFRNDLGVIDFARTPAAPGTGVVSPRQQLNTVSSFIDASNVYGVDKTRLEWLRNGARLLLTRGYLPRADARGNVAAAPTMDLFGAQVGHPAQAVVAGDVRANENIALTAIHTLFAREHNRIVAALPRSLSAETRFQVARRIVGAEIQYITYTQFLPAVGVRLRPYRGYDPNVNPGLSNEFAVVGYRAHSMIHGEFDVTVKTGTFPQRVLKGFRGAGITVKAAGRNVELTVPLDLAFGNPALLHTIGLGPILKSLGSEREYTNDEQIDNSLRSVLFQVPKPGVANPAACGSPAVNANCFTGVQDLGAIDVQRGRDHGMPSYNELRRAYELPPKRSFTAITGEATERLPLGISIDDPHSLDFVQLRDADGKIVPLGSDDAQEDAVVGIRRTTLAARLKAIYGSVNKLDAFVGMLSERHVPGTEFGRLQLAIWKKQFEALRDGDRFFYLNDAALATIRHLYGIDYRRTLAGLIRADTGAAVQADVFKAPSAFGSRPASRAGCDSRVQRLSVVRSGRGRRAIPARASRRSRA